MELRASHTETISLFDSSPLAIVAYDASGVVTHWNAAAEALFGWAEAEAVGKRYPVIPAEKQAQFEELLRRGLAGEKFTEPELERRKADGGPIVVRCWAAPLRGPDGSVCGIMEILNEVSDTKPQGDPLPLPSIALQQAGDSVIVTDARGFIQYVNTEYERKSGFREAEILGRKPSVVRSGLQDAAFYRKLWETISRGETWRGTLVNRRKDGTLYKQDAIIAPVRDPSGRIVSFVGTHRDPAPAEEAEQPPIRYEIPSPSDSARQIYQPRPLDLNRVLTAMDRMLTRLAGEGTRLSIEPGRALGRVMATAGKAEELMAGLTVHTRGLLGRGGRIVIRTSHVDLPAAGSGAHQGVPPGRYVLLSLEGSGEGSDPGNVTGPAAAFAIIRQFDGHMRIERTGECGVAFHVYFPRVDPRTVGRSGALKDRLGDLLPGNETILIVEDEDVVRVPAREILRSCGYTVIEARNGKEALVLSEANPGRIHLALTDVVMPKMDGLEFAHRLQSSRPDTRILFMSGYAHSEIGRIDNPENEIAFLHKPFTAEGLSAKVREVLDAP